MDWIKRIIDRRNKKNVNKKVQVIFGQPTPIEHINPHDSNVLWNMTDIDQINNKQKLREYVQIYYPDLIDHLDFRKKIKTLKQIIKEYK